MALPCVHHETRCINEFELIRKYQCLSCSAVMMCACEESVGKKFFRHQLEYGTELETQRRMWVTLGFQPFICRECRGLPPEAHPVAAIRGRTNKIRRYYWREIAFRTMELLEQWSHAHDSVSGAGRSLEANAARKDAADQALQEIKELHRISPKYTFHEESQSDVLRKCKVEIIDLKGNYARTPDGKRASVLEGGKPLSAEEFVQHHFAALGYESMFVESVPFHVLFGVYMWLLILDPADPHIRIVGFGDRTSFDAGIPGHQILMPLPDDFGTAGYARRRESEISRHISLIASEPDKLEWLFDYWLPHSESLRQYLWAHREQPIRTAGQLLKILPPNTLLNILRYLSDDYWNRFCGWPDLLVYRNSEFFFAEVKSSGDKLSDAQKNWITGNHNFLKLPFRLVKIHRDRATGVF